MILAQKLGRLISGARLSHVAAVLLLPFIGVVAAFGIAPDTVTEPVVRKQVVQELTLPATTAASDAADDYWNEERVQRGDTLAELMARLGVEDAAALQFLRNTPATRSLYQLAPGKAVRAHVSGDGRLLALRYQNGGKTLSVERQGDAFNASEAAIELERRVLVKSGEIRSSLFAATDAAGLSDAVATQMADIFSTDIDFHRDLRRGDHFSVVYEMFYDRGEPVRSGRVLAAEFVNAGQPYRAVYFQYSENQGSYYTPDGRNIRKAFLRSPLEFSRITSGFGNRFHPILKQWRQHKGIDYAAPVGTRVKATADGVVEFEGRSTGGYGNLVVLRHQSRYTTWYGHLSGFAKGLHKGEHVAQGDVIGYVGATGLATGPHLHYEFRINNVYQNPLKVALPAAPPINASLKPAFDAAVQPLAQQLSLLRDTQLSRLD